MNHSPKPVPALSHEEYQYALKQLDEFEVSEEMEAELENTGKQ